MNLQLDSCLACGSSNITKYLTTKSMMHDGQESFDFDTCKDCKLVFLNPRVNLSSLAEYYTDYYLPYRGASAWGKYAKLVEKDQAKIDVSRLKTIEKYSPLSRTSTVLDIGCGKPSFLKQVSDKYGCYAVGTDFSNEGWKETPELYQKLVLQQGLPDEVQLHSKADVITMWHYLEHDYDPKSTLTDILRHTTTNTALIIEVPDHSGDSRIKYKSHWSGYHTPRHTGLYNVDNMTTLLQRSGWEVVDSYRTGTLDPFTLVWMSEMERQQIDWSSSMESRFWRYVLGMVAYLPKRLSPAGRGFMTLVAKPKVQAT